MSEQNTADNWRLEDTGDTLDQWKLQEAEQARVAQWQLQRTQYGDPSWQPVDYERQPARRGSWLLPLLVGLALIAVFAYGVWIGLGTLGITNVASLWPSFQVVPTATPAGAAVSSVVVTTTVEATPTVAPIATATTAPTNTPELPPTPELKVEQQIVRITNQYGVNARREPTTEGDPMQVLQQGEEFLVIEEREDGWLQVALPSAELAWISSEFVESRTEQVLLEVANQRRTALGLPPLEASSALATTADGAVALVATATVVSQAITETTPITGTQPTTATQAVTNTAVLTGPVALGAGAEITGTVNITAGLNARSAPNTTAQPVVLLNGGTVLTITGRSADNEWLQIRLADNTVAWVFAEYVDIVAGVNASPVATPDATTAPAPTSSTAVTTTNEPTGTGPSASVSSLSGANARLVPDRNTAAFDVIPYDVVLTVEGRTADNEWLQVEYEGQLVWVLVSTVSLNTDLASLPVVTP